jgi:hypothetical protein
MMKVTRAVHQAFFFNMRIKTKSTVSRVAIREPGFTNGDVVPHLCGGVSVVGINEPRHRLFWG